MKSCQQCSKEFAILESDKLFYEKMDVLEPVLCPECRQQHRVAWRNERTLYTNTCELCKKPVVSIYSPNPIVGREQPFHVYCHECWGSEKWDSLTYGMDIDFNRPFFDQFKELQAHVPCAAMLNSNSENSQYTNYAANNKNCYLIFSNGYGHNEDCYYGTMLAKNRGCLDAIQLEDCENCYECIDCTSCYNLSHGKMCSQCIDSFFLEDCRNCSNCFMCKGLRNKQYHILNKPHSREEYEKKLHEYALHTRTGRTKAKKEFDAFRQTIPSAYSYQLHTEECTGDYIMKSSHCTQCFDTTDTENCRYLQYSVNHNKDVQDCSYTGGLELGAEIMGCVGGYHCIGSTIIWWDVANLEYCAYMFNGAQNCFGCIGIRGKKWCILNKQYSEEEYHSLRLKIITKLKETGEWGHFFSPSLSYFGYNETVAHDYFPLEREEAIRLGYTWNDRIQGTKGKEDIAQTDVADSITHVPEHILQKTLSCKDCQKNYRIVKQEFEFYKKHAMPLPEKCFNCRHLERLANRRPRKLWKRQCMCRENSHTHAERCEIEFETSFSPESQELVYCKECYLKEIE